MGGEELEAASKGYSVLEFTINGEQRWRREYDQEQFVLFLMGEVTTYLYADGKDPVEREK